MTEIVNTSVICDDIEVFYDYVKLDPIKNLNPMGNFYRYNHLHKKTQKIMENYLKSVEVPKIGDQVISDELFLKLTITNIIDNHKKDNGE